MSNEPKYMLLANDMRSLKYEHMTAVAIGSREEIDALVARETVSTCMDGQWAKSFRQGGPLEWLNVSSISIQPFGVPRAVDL